MEENNLNVTPSNKQSKSTVIIMVIMMLVILGLGGFIVYDKFIKDDTSEGEKPVATPTPSAEPSSDKDVEKELNLNDEGIQKMALIHKVFSSEDKELVEAFYKNDLTIVSSLSNDLKLDILAYRVLWGKSTSKDNSYYYVDSATVLEEWKKLYRSNTSFPKISEKAKEMGFLEDGRYRYSLNSDGKGVGVIATENTLLKATSISDTIVLYEDVAFVVELEGTYSDYNHTIKYNENNKKANYKFTYKKDTDGNYYFYSIEKVK